jgi:hypothetical protein
MSLISEASAFDSVTLSAFESADLKWAYVPNAKSVSSEARMALVVRTSILGPQGR